MRWIVRIAVVWFVFVALIVGALAVGATMDGDVLAFEAFVRFSVDIMLHDVEHHITANSTRTPFEYELSPAWSPDGRWLAVTCNLGDANWICVFDPFASRGRWRTERRAFRLGDPQWSPDGSMITAHALDENRINLHYYLATFSTDGKPALSAGERIGGAYGSGHTWMPDSEHLVYSNRNGDFVSRIMIQSIFTAEPRELPQPDGDNIDPTPSPDGRWIAFNHLHNGTWQLMLLDLQTGDYTALTEGGRYDAGDLLPVWSPDGGQLAFVSSRDNLMDSTNDVYFLDMADRSLHQMTATHSINDMEPVWSPDGTKITLQSPYDYYFQLNILDLVTGFITPIMVDRTNTESAVWQP